MPLASEILVGNPRYSAGTLDFLCLWEDKLTLVDFKTSNSVMSKDFVMQVSAYKYFFQKMTGLTIKQIKIIHLSKDMDKFGLWQVARPAEAYRAFRSLCVFYRWWINPADKLVKDVKKMVL